MRLSSRRRGMTAIRKLGAHTSSPASPSCHKADSPSSYPGTGKQSAKILEPLEPRHSLDDYDGRVNPGHDDARRESAHAPGCLSVLPRRKQPFPIRLYQRQDEVVRRRPLTAHATTPDEPAIQEVDLPKTIKMSC